MLLLEHLVGLVFVVYTLVRFWLYEKKHTLALEPKGT